VAPIVNSEISQEAEASEVVLNFLPEAEGIDQTLKVVKDQASKEIEVASKVILEGSLEAAEVGLMLLASTTTTETNFHPEDLKMMKDLVNFNQDPSEAVEVSEEVISKIEEAVECTQEEVATEAVVLKATRTEVEEAASVEKEVATVAVASTVKRAVVEEVATVAVASRMKKASVAEEVATVVVAMMEMRTEAVLEEDMLVLTPLPPSLLLRPEEEANLPTTER
jgi:hypothetical protein